ncbi:hypothetical protein [Streptomyces sp. NPDC002845]
MDPTSPPGGGIFYNIAKDGMRYLNKRRREMGIKRARTRFEKMEAARANPNIYRFLKWLYSQEPVLERCGEVYPVAIYEAPYDQRRDVESILLDLAVRDSTKEWLVHNAKHRKNLELVGRNLHNRTTFTMQEMVTNGRLGLKCSTGSYFDGLDTCDVLERELLEKISYLEGSDERSFERFLRKLPLRSRLHREIQDPLRSGFGRSVAVSISTLIAFHYDGDTRLMMRKRSPLTAAHPNLFHVIPSFMFQPATTALRDEFSVRNNIYREYLEELFDRAEPEQGADDPSYFYGDANLNYLQNLMARGAAELYLTGVAVNLLSLRPDICTLLHVRTDEWYRHHSGRFSEQGKFHLCDEFASRIDSLDEDIRGVVYRSVDEEVVTHNPIRAHTVVPPGAGALWLGIDALRSGIVHSPGEP